MDYGGKVIAFVLGAIIIFSVLYYSINATVNRQVTLDVRNYTNYTYYRHDYIPIYTSTFHLYYNNSDQFEIDSAHYDLNSSHIRTIANGTDSYPNITDYTNYYSSYTWYPTFTVWGTDWLVLIGLIVLVTMMIVAYYLVKQSQKK